MTRGRGPARATALLLLVGAAAAALLAAGCGGGGGKPAATTAPTEQQVKGAGYSFAAPVGWHVAATDRGIEAQGPGTSLLSVAVYKLVKAYRPATFAAAAKELDKVAAQLAAGRSGKVASRATTRVAGLQVRTYSIDYKHADAALLQQVTFVLRDTTEWLLVCRRAAADPDAPCARLLTSFTLASR